MREQIPTPLFLTQCPKIGCRCGIILQYITQVCHATDLAWTICTCPDVQTATDLRLSVCLSVGRSVCPCLASGGNTSRLPHLYKAGTIDLQVLSGLILHTGQIPHRLALIRVGNTTMLSRSRQTLTYDCRVVVIRPSRHSLFLSLIVAWV